MSRVSCETACIYSLAGWHLMKTNTHVHLFSADHAPSAQVYYLLRGALHGAARGMLPTVLGREVTTDDLRQLDRSLDRFEWPWPMLFNAAVGASSLAGRHWSH